LNRSWDGDRVDLIKAPSHLFDGADDQLVSRLGLGSIDGVDGKLENAGSLSFYGRDTESGEMLDDVDDLVEFVDVNEIERKEDAEGMNSTGRQNPEAFVDTKPDLSDEAFEAREGGVGGKNSEAKEAFPRLVVHAIGSFLHVIRVNRSRMFMCPETGLDHPFF
jgi:hypothetical protein